MHVLYCTVLYCTVLVLDWTGLDCTVLRTRSEAREMYTPVQIIVKIQSVQTGSDGTCVAPVLFIHITHDSKYPTFQTFPFIHNGAHFHCKNDTKLRSKLREYLRSYDTVESAVTTMALWVEKRSQKRT